MTMAFVEDITPYFGDFGVLVTLNGAPVEVIFDDAHAAAFGGMVSGTGPQAIAQDSVNAARGQTLVHGAKSYTVIGVEPDGTGLTLLRLEEA